jgi:glycine/D-amino acid oxidase-like deaminating enzyme
MQDLATRSYWLGLDPYEPGPPLESELEADVVIIGGGFTGLWTAYHLLKASPNSSVVVLEANAVGYGASGRNGGFAMTLIHRSLAALAESVGDEGARALHDGAVEAIRSLERVCNEEGIDAHLMPNGAITVSNSPAQDEIIRGEMETAQRLGLEGFQYLEGDQVQSMVHSPTFRCAVSEPNCTLVNPARLVRGLKEAVVRLGAQVFEATPLEELGHYGPKVSARTPRGVVRADRAVLAANGYAARLPQLGKYVLPFYSYILLTEPLSEEQWQSVGWEGREGIEDRRTFLHYFRPTVDGRILWGGRDAPFRADGPNPRYDRDEHVFERAEETFRWTFPQLKDVKIEQAWGGPIGVTARFLPCIGWLEGRRVAFGFAYNGHGVSISNLAAMCLRDMLLDRETDLTRLPLVNLKPVDMGPRFIRDPLVRMQTRSLQKADDEGREAKEPVLLKIFERLGR